tara:strand:+ start:6475 stop:7800 length:1326 start_codon:yes stop_codon:yes gene_type:complete
MRFFITIIILLLINNCSFDNKSGIWKNENELSNEENKEFSSFEKLSLETKMFDEIIELKPNYKFNLTNAISPNSWTDIYYDKDNNLKNFKYSDLNKLIYKTKKLSKRDISKNILYKNGKIVSSDSKGNIIIFSLEKNIVDGKYNFYKKRYKKIKKKLNIIIEKNIIYVSDNIGFIYAININTQAIVWAKNFKVPFRSNLKIYENKLIAANQNNNLFFINKKNGNIVKNIPTEETQVQNEFINNLSISGELLFFLNTYGTIYSLNVNSMKILWFLNLNQSLDISVSNLFFGSTVVANKRKLVVSSKDNTYILDNLSGSIIFKKNFSVATRPILVNQHLFLITNNNLLVSIDTQKVEIVYSYDINKKVAEFFNTKKKKIDFKNFLIVNNQLFVFLENSYLLKFKIDGSLENVLKLPNKIKTNPIFLNNSLIYSDFKNRISILN